MKRSERAPGISRHRLLAIGALACCAAAAGGAAAGAETTWKAGVARAAITPSEPLWLAGYSHRDRPAEGKVHDLWVKVLALEDGRGRRAAVVTSDLLGFPREISDAIAREVESACGLGRSALLLSSSHTHSGPVLARALMPCYPLDAEQLARIERYSRWLEEEVARTVAAALRDLRPAVLEAGEGTAGFAVNRRNNREAEVAKMKAEGRELAGPVDPTVPVLAVRSPEGRLIAAVFGYACHNTNLDGYLWCGDYAGFAQIALERDNLGAQAMFWEGCGADQNPLPRRSLDLCKGYGEELAAAVRKTLSGPMRPIGPALETSFRLVDLGLAPLPPKEEIGALAGKGAAYQQRWAQRLLQDLAAGREIPKSYSYPIQVWRLGADQLWIVLGGEVVVDYAHRFRKEHGPRTWTAGYSNDVMAYIPSRRIQDEGGYEAGAMQVYGLPAPGWANDIEERVAAAVKEMVGALPRS